MTAFAEPQSPRPGPLSGLTVVDLSTIVAAPFASALLADYGATVIKVELPRVGDPLRALPPHAQGVPLWWKVTNRNKRGVTLDLRREEAKELLRRLVSHADVLVENFRPGTLDRWGYPGRWLRSINRRLTILRVTGFGQTGPARDQPGFARVFEAKSGFTNLCGAAGGPPLHVGYPIADAIGGLFGAVGVLAALHAKAADRDAPGQEIDCSITEAMLRVLEFLPIEYDQLGTVRSRSGSASLYAAPGNVYATRDGKHASIAASTQSIFVRLCRALDLTHLTTDARFADNPSRVANSAKLDGYIAAAVGRFTLEELSNLLGRSGVGFSPINDIADVFNDPQLQAREAIVPVPDPELGEVRMQAVVPRFSLTPGEVGTAGPSLGQHNDEVWSELGFSDEEIAEFRRSQVI